MMPLDETLAHLQLVVGSGIVLSGPGHEQPIPMPPGAAERMCADLDARGEHAEAARHRRALQVLQSVAQRIESSCGSRSGEGA
jgi:hypothetical protein